MGNLNMIIVLLTHRNIGIPQNIYLLPFCQRKEKKKEMWRNNPIIISEKYMSNIKLHCMNKFSLNFLAICVQKTTATMWVTNAHPSVSDRKYPDRLLPTSISAFILLATNSSRKCKSIRTIIYRTKVRTWVSIVQKKNKGKEKKTRRRKKPHIQTLRNIKKK